MVDGAYRAAPRSTLGEGNVPMPSVDGDGDCSVSLDFSSPGVEETSSTSDARSVENTPPALRTCRRQLGHFLHGPHDDQEARVGRTRAQERTLREVPGVEVAAQNPSGEGGTRSDGVLEEKEQEQDRSQQGEAAGAVRGWI